VFTTARPSPFITFLNKLPFNGEELVAHRPFSRLENHPLSAFRECLFKYIHSYTTWQYSHAHSHALLYSVGLR